MGGRHAIERQVGGRAERDTLRAGQQHGRAQDHGIGTGSRKEIGRRGEVPPRADRLQLGDRVPGPGDGSPGVRLPAADIAGGATAPAADRELTHSVHAVSIPQGKQGKENVGTEVAVIGKRGHESEKGRKQEKKIREKKIDQYHLPFPHLLFLLFFRAFALSRFRVPLAKRFPTALAA